MNASAQKPAFYLKNPKTFKIEELFLKVDILVVYRLQYSTRALKSIFNHAMPTYQSKSYVWAPHFALGQFNKNFTTDFFLNQVKSLMILVTLTCMLDMLDLSIKTTISAY